MPTHRLHDKSKHIQKLYQYKTYGQAGHGARRHTFHIINSSCINEAGGTYSEYESEFEIKLVGSGNYTCDRSKTMQ